MAINFCLIVYSYIILNSSSTILINLVYNILVLKRHLKTKVLLNNRAQTDSNTKLVV
jgi:hypothetical protein